MKISTCGSRENTAIRLNYSQELIVPIQLQIRDIRRRPAVDNQFVEDLKLLAFLHLSFPIPIDGARKPHPHSNSHPIITHHLIQMLLIFLKFEICQEPQRPKGEREDRRDDTLEEPGGKEYSSVAAECEDQVEFLRLRPAEVGRPVFKHVLVAWLFFQEAGGVESF